MFVLLTGQTSDSPSIPFFLQLFFGLISFPFWRSTNSRTAKEEEKEIESRPKRRRRKANKNPGRSILDFTLIDSLFDISTAINRWWHSKTWPSWTTTQTQIPSLNIWWFIWFFQIQQSLCFRPTRGQIIIEIKRTFQIKRKLQKAKVGWNDDLDICFLSIRKLAFQDRWQTHRQRSESF